ncbi:MAG TPA: sulfatase-like hydrolase/transferase [Bacteroidales bacterium]|nr:sulfatase-like hydrolase/transferase [Bacteroidales bacterium]
MRKRFYSLLLYAVYWLILFVFARVFFLFFHYQSSFQETVGGLLGTFINGVKLDISTTGYYLLLPSLVIILTVFFEGKWYAFIMRFYTLLLTFFTSIIVVGDANLYSYWGFRMDYTPLFYLKTPGEAIASVSIFTVILSFGGILLITWAFFKFYRKIVDNRFLTLGSSDNRLISSLLFLLLTAALIIPIRGGFGVAPINAGSVYFSERMFLNHAAINPVWNVGTTAFSQKPVENPYVFTEKAKAEETYKSFADSKDGETINLLNIDNPNVLMIILESFSSYLVGPSGGDSLVTPELNRYSREGVLFRNIYASGTRTDKALPAILNGYPAQPAQSIIKEPRKTQSLSGIVRLLEANGYSSSFWYGGDINFANFNSYVVASGFEEIVTMDDFNGADMNSKWGVHDHIMFEALKKSFTGIKKPFLKVVLTLSSHEPFDVPMEQVFSGNDNLTKYKNSVYYTDKNLGSFLDWSKEQEWWDSTLVILVADHGCRISADMEPWATDLFKIPMVWTGGAVSGRGIIIDKVGSQTDIPVTLLNQLKINGSFPFSKDLLSSGSGSYAFYSFNEGFGFVTDSSAVAYDQKPKTVVWQSGKSTGTEGKGKAYLQVLFDDYLSR